MTVPIYRNNIEVLKQLKFIEKPPIVFYSNQSLTEAEIRSEIRTGEKKSLWHFKEVTLVKYELK